MGVSGASWFFGGPESPDSVISNFEDGTFDTVHSEWGSWTHRGDSSHSLDDTGAMYDTWSLRNDWSGGINSLSVVSRSSGVKSDFRYSVKLSNQSGDGDDDCTIDFRDTSGGSGSSWLDWRQNGNLVWRPQDGSGEVTLGVWSAGTIYDVRYYVDYANGSVDIEVNGTTHTGLNWRPNYVDNIRMRNQNNSSGQNCSFYIDEVYEE